MREGEVIADRDDRDAAHSGRYPQIGWGALPVKDAGRLLVRCPDKPGLVAAVSAFLAAAGANIVSLDQHSTEQSGGTSVQRTIFHLPGLTAARDALERDFAEQLAARFEMDFRLTEAAKPKRVAIMASKDDHCLLDLLGRNRCHGRSCGIARTASSGTATRPSSSEGIIPSRTEYGDHDHHP